MGILCLKRYFDAQRYDQAGRHAVRLQKSIIILFMIAFAKLFLSILVDPITAIIVFAFTSVFLVIGWKGATQRRTGLLLAYQMLASFVFFFCVAMVSFGLVFMFVAIATSNQRNGMQDLTPPDNNGGDEYTEATPLTFPGQNGGTMMPLHPHTKQHMLLESYDQYMPSLVHSHVPVVRESIDALIRHHSSNSDNNDNNDNSNSNEGTGSSPVPLVDPNAESSDAAAPIGAAVVVMLFVVLLLVILLVFLMFVVFFTVVPMIALFCSIFFSAACRRMLLIQRSAAAVEAEHAQQMTATAAPVQTMPMQTQAMPMQAYPMQMMMPVSASELKGNAAAPAAGAAALAPAGVVYMPQTNMFPMAPNGYVANPYSGVIYVAGNDEPRK